MDYDNVTGLHHLESTVASATAVAIITVPASVIVTVSASDRVQGQITEAYRCIVDVGKQCVEQVHQWAKMKGRISFASSVGDTHLYVPGPDNLSLWLQLLCEDDDSNVATGE